MQPLVIKRHNVRIERGREAMAATAEETPVEEEHAEKAVRLLEENGVVSALEVRCACGQVTVIELEYPGPSQTV